MPNLFDALMRYDGKDLIEGIEEQYGVDIRTERAH
jgi:hypothetical protein